jgi:spermidine synthase
MLFKNAAKRFAIPATVCITGACVLVVEIVATRVLAPYFGNTIFSVTSVISVVLAALAIGYYVGGKLADRRPSKRIFFGLVFAGGMSVFVLYWMQLVLLPNMAGHLPLTTGPLIMAIILFFVPGLILGTLSPFAIKLQAMILEKEGIGSISGVIFFYSTMGSIFGSLMAGFVLIPMFGVHATLIGVGVVLVALGIVPLVLLGADRRFLGKLSLLAVVVVLLLAMVTPSAGKALYSRDGLYERLYIVDDTYHGKPIRSLYQDRSVSGGMYVGSDEHLHNYTKYYSLYEIFTPNPKRILAIGGGVYTVPKSYLKDLPEATIDVAEIEPSLVELGETYFGVPKDERLNHYIEDGRRLLNDQSQPYDVIFGDAYHSLYSVPAHLTTKEFFQNVHDKLTGGGLFIMNVIGSLDSKPPSLALSEVRTLKTIFPNVYLFAVENRDSPMIQNLMVVAHKSNKRVGFESDAIKASKHEVIRNLSSRQVDLHKIDLSPYPIVTDDLAPVETWTAELLRRYGK